jgi:hypothetical protein
MPVFQYPVLELLPESSERFEALGSKPKFWFRMQETGKPWLFKFARPNTGEDWAEKISAELAGLLGLSHATIELATFMEKRGSASPTFVPDDSGLIHGNEILAGQGHIRGYDPAKKFGQSDHTFPRIVAAFYNIFPEGPERTEALTMLAGYLVLDAMICNVDRHHENWAILRSTSTGTAALRIAPTFDHASSLGRELRDEKRSDVLRQKRVGEYVQKGSGAIYWKETDVRGANPLSLAIRAATAHRSYFQRWIDRIKDVAPAELDLLVSRVPEDWMSPIAKEFAVAILSYTTEQLKRL